MVRYEIGPSLHLKMENDQIQNEGILGYSTENSDPFPENLVRHW